MLPEILIGINSGCCVFLVQACLSLLVIFTLLYIQIRESQERNGTLERELDHYKDSYQTAMAEVCVLVTCVHFVNLKIIYDNTG